MDEELGEHLLGVTFILSIIAGYTIVEPVTDEFSFYLFGGFSVGVLIFTGVFFYQTDSQ